MRFDNANREDVQNSSSEKRMRSLKPNLDETMSGFRNHLDVELKTEDALQSLSLEDIDSFCCMLQRAITEIDQDAKVREDRVAADKEDEDVIICITDTETEDDFIIPKGMEHFLKLLLLNSNLCKALFSQAILHDVVDDKMFHEMHSSDISTMKQLHSIVSCIEFSSTISKYENAMEFQIQSIIDLLLYKMRLQCRFFTFKEARVISSDGSVQSKGGYVKKIALKKDTARWKILCHPCSCVGGEPQEFNIVCTWSLGMVEDVTCCEIPFE